MFGWEYRKIGKTFFDGGGARTEMIVGVVVMVIIINIVFFC